MMRVTSSPTGNWRVPAIGFALGIGVVVAGCGDDEGGPALCPSAACQCVANDCLCAPGGSCAWTSAGDDSFTCGSGAVCDVGCGGANCEIDCNGSQSCDVQTGNSVDVDCTDDARCVVAAGRSADLLCDASTCTFSGSDETDVICRGGATCEVTCSARCTVACEGAATTCTLRCAGDDGPAPVTGTGACST